MLPGEVIDRKQLAEQYNVSTAPVKDALLMLAQDGFIDVRARSVTIVKSVQREDIDGIMVMREAIETQAARMICGDILRSHFDELEVEAKNLNNISDQMEYWRADIEFHRHLVALTDCPLMINTYRQIMNIGNFYRMNSFFMNDSPTGRLNHIDLLNDLLTEDASVADECIRRHLRSGKGSL